MVAARATEVEARLAVRTGEERADALAGRVEQIEQAAAAEREARERAAALAERRAREAVVGGRRSRRWPRSRSTALERSLQAAAAERTATEEQRTVTEGELLASARPVVSSPASSRR